MSAKQLDIDKTRTAYFLGEKEKHFIHQIKYFRRFELLKHVNGQDLALKTFEKVEGIVPVPLHYKRFRERSFNQAELLAKIVSKSLQVPLVRDLVKVRETGAQALLSMRERKKNLSGAFRWIGKRQPPQSVLIVDDIFTTGSTLNQCAKVLRKRGSREVYAWSLFRPPYLQKGSS